MTDAAVMERQPGETGGRPEATEADEAHRAGREDATASDAETGPQDDGEPDESRPPGSVVSFYSFKGGVGRSMLLAHLAWVLAERGRRVLVVDWDLEAPGLREYFQPRRSSRLSQSAATRVVAPDATGVLGLVDDYKARIGYAYERLASESRSTLIDDLTDELTQGAAEAVLETLPSSGDPPGGALGPRLREQLTRHVEQTIDAVPDSVFAGARGPGMNGPERAKTLIIQQLNEGISRITRDLASGRATSPAAARRAAVTAAVSAEIREAVTRTYDEIILTAEADSSDPDRRYDSRILEQAVIEVLGKLGRSFRGYTETVVGQYSDISQNIDFMPAGPWNVGYAELAASVDWAYFLRHLGGIELMGRVRDWMKRAYDYVLIDSRTGISDTWGICTKLLPDLVVVCFSTNDQNILNAADITKSIIYGGDSDAAPNEFGESSAEPTSGRAEKPPARILAVPSRVNLSNNVAARKARVVYEEEFFNLVDFGGLSPREYWDGVCVPYEPAYSYVETPPLFARSDGDRVLKAVEFIASRITGGEVRFTPDPATWNELLSTFERPPLNGDYTHFVVSHSDDDESTARWIKWLLEAHGMEVRLQAAQSLGPPILDDQLNEAGGDPGNPSSGGTLCVLPLLNRKYAESTFAGATWEWARRRVSAGGFPVLLPVRVEQAFVLSDPFSGSVGCVDLWPALDHDPPMTGYAEEILIGAISDALRGVPKRPRGPEPRLLPPGARPENVDRLLTPNSPDDLYRDDQDSVARFDRLLAEVLLHNNQQTIAKLLEDALEVARNRGDALREARAGFRLAEEQLRAPDGAARAEQTALEAADAVLRMTDRDIVFDNEGKPLLLSRSPGFRDQVQPVAAAMNHFMGRFSSRAQNRAGRRPPQITLAAGVLFRLSWDPSLARGKFIEARHDAERVSRGLVARCDLELGYLALHRAARSESQPVGDLDAAEGHLHEARRAGDDGTKFLAAVGLGLTELRRAKASEGRSRQEKGWQAADGYFSGVLPRQYRPGEPADERTTLLLGHLGSLTEISGRTPSALGRLLHGGRTTAGNGPPDLYEPAAKAAGNLIPCVSLPLAWALERSCQKDSSLAMDIQRERLVQALWIYFSLGETGLKGSSGMIRERFIECTDLARALFRGWRRENVKKRVETYKIADIGFIADLLTRDEPFPTQVSTV